MKEPAASHGVGIFQNPNLGPKPVFTILENQSEGSKVRTDSRTSGQGCTSTQPLPAGSGFKKKEWLSTGP